MSPEATMHEFHTPEPVDLRVELWAGQIDITAQDTDQTTVELEPMHGDSAAQDAIANARVEQRGREIVVLMPRIKGGFFGRKGEVHATIRVPVDSNLDIEAASADLEGEGRFGTVSVATGSGEVELDHIADGTLKTGSGDVAVETVTGSLVTKCGSGELQLGSVGGDLDATAGSGDVVIGDVQGSLKVKTGSGDVVVRSSGESADVLAGSGDVLVKRVARGRLKARTGSGDVSVAVAEGTSAYLDIMTVTGDVTSSLDSSDAPADGAPTAEIYIQSGSGDVVLQRA